MALGKFVTLLPNILQFFVYILSRRCAKFSINFAVIALLVVPIFSNIGGGRWLLPREYTLLIYYTLILQLVPLNYLKSRQLIDLISYAERHLLLQPKRKPIQSQRNWLRKTLVLVLARVNKVAGQSFLLHIKVTQV